MTQPGRGGAPVPIVTVWATYGAGLDEFGPKLAEKLGVPLHEGAFSSDDLHDAAENGGGANEPDGDSWYLVQAIYQQGRAFKWRNIFQGVKRGREEQRQDLINAVQADARRGGVFLGRNATVILGRYPGALHVKLDGPLEGRIKRLTDLGIPESKVREDQQFEDNVRSQMSVALFDWDPLGTDRYDLVLNTVALGIDTAVQIAAEASRAKMGGAHPEAPPPPAG
ncbi:MAG: cytidylate kinase family protein [bacterium]|nr:cytidylate kinase family protein [bacterium]